MPNQDVIEGSTSSRDLKCRFYDAGESVLSIERQRAWFVHTHRAAHAGRRDASLLQDRRINAHRHLSHEASKEIDAE